MNLPSCSLQEAGGGGVDHGLAAVGGSARPLPSAAPDTSAGSGDAHRATFFGFPAPLGRREDRSESFRGDNPGGVAAGTGAGCKPVVAGDKVQAERIADSEGSGEHSSSGSGSECKRFILPGTALELESAAQKESPHIETPMEFFTASPPMGLLLIKPAERLLFYTGADIREQCA